MTESTPPILMVKPAEVGRILGLGRSMTYQLLRDGVIPSVMVGGSRRVRVADLEAYVESLATNASTLEQRLAPIVRELWGADPEASESAPSQATVAYHAGYRSKRGLEKALAREPGLWRRLTARRP